jgi:UDP-N-acetylglucosamine pyrophosphorylase
LEKYKQILKDNNQTHLQKYIDMCNEEERKNLIKEIESIDFDKLNKLYKISKRPIKIEKGLIIEHIAFKDKYKLSEDKYNELKDLGEDIIKNNHYAVVTMAGGQGTRLGHDGPKGSFLLDVKPEPKYLFQILAENLIRHNQNYGITLNWYIMTSTENNDQTVEFFEKHNYFGYDPSYIKFFEQGNLPLLFEDGRLIVDKGYHIKLAADGNGCIYKAMKEAGILDDMESKGIKWIFIGSVDNALLNMVDPLLIGLTIKEGNEIGSKSVAKANPKEKVGVFCKKDGKPGVIEYSELPEAMAEEVDEDGELLYGESHIMCNLYSLSALKIIASKNLPYHSANKKAPYMDENGEIVKVTEPNGYKYEAFIFDGFNYFKEISILRGKREDDFAPVKNAEGVDSPETATKLYNDFWATHKSQNERQ